MKKFEGFNHFLTEMIVNKEQSGNIIIAFRQWLWIVNYNSDKYFEILNSILSVHPQRDKLRKLISRIDDIESLISWLNDYIPDVLCGCLINHGNTLQINQSSMTISLTTSPLVKKVARELGVKNVNYSYYDEDDEDAVLRKKVKSLRGNLDVIWYHGTTSKYLYDILRLGLKPGERGSNYIDQDIVHDDIIFLAAKLDEAQHHAWHTVNRVGGHPIVLQVNKIPDKSLIIPDYDVDRLSSQNIYNHFGSREHDAIYSTDSNRAMKDAGLIGYKGRIPASMFSAVILYSSYSKKWIRFRDLSRLRRILIDYGEDFFQRYGDPVVPTRRRGYGY